MKSRYTFIALLIFHFSFCIAQVSPRKKINIDDNWKFHLGNAADAAKDFNYSISTIFAKSGAQNGTAIDPHFDDKPWRTLDLPHDWVVELPFVNVRNGDVEGHGFKPVGGLFPETSIGWYRKHFTLNNSANKKVSIYFDGVYMNSDVWINEHHLGNHPYG